MKKHIVGYCASFGLAIGIVMFLGALSLRHIPDSAFGHIFQMLNLPAIGLIKQLHGDSYDWSSLAGLSQALLAFLACWTLLGTLAGFGLRGAFSRKHHVTAA